MLSLAVDAKDSITMAISYPNGQPQQRDPTAEYGLKIQPIVQNRLPFHLPSLLLKMGLVLVLRVSAALTK